jgi:hypothetical protein
LFDEFTGVLTDKDYVQMMGAVPSTVRQHIAFFTAAVSNLLICVRLNEHESK